MGKRQSTNEEAMQMASKQTRIRGRIGQHPFYANISESLKEPGRYCIVIHCDARKPVQVASKRISTGYGAMRWEIKSETITRGLETMRKNIGLNDWAPINYSVWSERPIEETYDYFASGGYDKTKPQPCTPISCDKPRMDSKDLRIAELERVVMAVGGQRDSLALKLDKHDKDLQLQIRAKCAAIEARDKLLSENESLRLSQLSSANKANDYRIECDRLRRELEKAFNSRTIEPGCMVRVKLSATEHTRNVMSNVFKSHPVIVTMEYNEYELDVSELKQLFACLDVFAITRI